MKHLTLFLVLIATTLFICCGGYEDDGTCGSTPDSFFMVIRDSMDNDVIGSAYNQDLFRIFDNEQIDILVEREDNGLDIPFELIPSGGEYLLELSENVIDTIFIEWSSIEGFCGEIYTIEELVYNSGPLNGTIDISQVIVTR